MKRIQIFVVLFILSAAIFNCGNSGKKKGLLPLLALTQGNSGSTNSTSSASGTSTGTSTTSSSSPANAAETAGTTTVAQSEQAVSTPSTTASTTGDSNTSSNSGSTTDSSSSSSTDSSNSSNSTTTSSSTSNESNNSSSSDSNNATSSTNSNTSDSSSSSSSNSNNSTSTTNNSSSDSTSGNSSTTGNNSNTGSSSNSSNTDSTSNNSGNSSNSANSSNSSNSSNGNYGSNPENSQGAAQADAKCKTKKASMDTTKGKWYETPESDESDEHGKKYKVSGIHTFWGGEKLYIKATGLCASGTYDLTLRAKNQFGNLPSFYTKYIFNVTNEKTGKTYALQIDASDKKYNDGTVQLYLESGDTDISLVWTNEAYKEGSYDANLHINKATLSLASSVASNKGLTKKADSDICSTEGSFYFPGNNKVVAFYSGKSLSYCFGDTKPGKYKVNLRAKNFKNLPDGYAAFKVQVDSGNDSQIALVPASYEELKDGYVTMNIMTDTSKLSLTWLNDSYVSDTKAAAIEYDEVSIERTGDLEGSNLAAYMAFYTTGGRIGLIAGLVTLLGLAFLVRNYRLRKEAV